MLATARDGEAQLRTMSEDAQRREAFGPGRRWCDVGSWQKIVQRRYSERWSLGRVTRLRSRGRKFPKVCVGDIPDDTRPDPDGVRGLFDSSPGAPVHPLCTLTAESCTTLDTRSGCLITSAVFYYYPTRFRSLYSGSESGLQLRISRLLGVLLTGLLS